VALHELARAEASEQRQGLVYIHGVSRFLIFDVTRFSCDNSPMEITQQCVVGLTWTLKDTLGEVLDVLEAPVEFLVGGADLFAKIEESLQGHEAGAKVDLHLEPEEAFGDYNDQLIFLEPRELFPPELGKA